MYTIEKTNDSTLIKISYANLDVILSTFGAAIVDIKFIDKNNIKESVIVKPKNKSDFNKNYFGKTCGRYSGRIIDGKFNLDKTYKLERNWNDLANLHGGSNGVSTFNWDFQLEEKANETVVIFTITSPDGSSGFPGNLNIKAIYTINNESIEIEYLANTDKKTLCNLTNHTYFNLSGDCKRDILNHNLTVNSNQYVKLNSKILPEKIIESSETFIFDNKKIKTNIYDEELKITKGYDHCLLLENANYSNNNIVLFEEESSRCLEIYTTYPSVVIYTSQNDKNIILDNSKICNSFDAICLECQYIPNGINMNVIDNSILDVNQLYNEKIKFFLKLI